MKNIILALDNPEIYDMLKKEKNIKLVSKDISYKEGILEQIEKNKKIDLIIFDEKIDGEIILYKLIKSIKEKIKNIEIIIITENKNELIKEIYRFKKIKIYETKKIKIRDLMELINSEKKEEKEIEIPKDKNIISISGAEGIGKTTISIAISKIYFNQKKLKISNKLEQKILIIDFNSNENQDIPNILNIKNKNTIQKIEKNISTISTNKISKIEKIITENKYENIIIDLGNKIEKNEKENILKLSDKNIILLEPNLIGIKKCEKLVKSYIEEFKIKKEKIHILINKKNKYSIDNEILKRKIRGINFIGEIKYNIKYEKFINNKFNNLKLELKKEEIKNIQNLLKKIIN